MKLVFIVGPHAVGKMTVGQLLCKRTGMKLLHNHMIKDTIYDIFPDEINRWELTELVRNEIFKRFAESDQQGMVFTFMPAYNKPSNLAYIDRIEQIFKEKNADIYYVELWADQKCRLERNRTENRLLNKVSKRNIQDSEEEILRLEKDNRYVSIDGEYAGKQYLRVDNSELSPGEVVEIICEKWNMGGD